MTDDPPLWLNNLFNRYIDAGYRIEEYGEAALAGRAGCLMIWDEIEL